MRQMPYQSAGLYCRRQYLVREIEMLISTADGSYEAVTLTENQTQKFPHFAKK